MKTTFFSMLVVLCLAVVPGQVRADGADMFDKKCVGCHGKDGKANTMMGRRLNMRDLSNPKVQASASDARWEAIILEGVKGEGGKNVMPATKATPDEAKALVKILRTLKK